MRSATDRYTEPIDLSRFMDRPAPCSCCATEHRHVIWIGRAEGILISGIVVALWRGWMTVSALLQL